MFGFCSFSRGSWSGLLAVAPRPPKGAIWGHFGVSFRGILKCFLYDSLYKMWCLCSRLYWIQIIFLEPGLQVLLYSFILFDMFFSFSSLLCGRGCMLQM